MPYRGPEGFTWRSSDISARRRALAAVVLLAAGWAIGFFAGRMSAWLFPVVQPSDMATVANVTPPTAIIPPSAQPPSTPPPRTAQASARPAAALAIESGSGSRSSPDDKVASRAGSSAAEQTGPVPEKAPSAPDASTAAAENPSPARDKSEPAPAQRAVKAEPSAGAATEDTRQREAAKAPGGDVVLVNPEWKQAPSKADREPDAERRAYRPEAETGQGRFADESAFAKCESRYSSFRPSDGTYQPYGRSTREPCPFLSDMPRRSRY